MKYEDTFTEITDGVKITVKTDYRKDYSDPIRFNFLFSYKITIENQNDYTVQLLARHWFVFDSCSEYREIKGEGVVGQKPTLGAGEMHEYESACNLTTEMGKMYGTFTFERKIDNKEFKVIIPEFDLIVPYKLN